MTSFLAKNKYGTKSLTPTLQKHFIKETFAKNRMSKALFVQKKIAQTGRHIFIHYKDDCTEARILDRKSAFFRILGHMSIFDPKALIFCLQDLE